MAINRKYLLKKIRLQNEPNWDDLYRQTVINLEGDDYLKNYKVGFEALYRCFAFYKLLYFIQIVKGICQDFGTRPIRIISHEEPQLRIAREKLRNDPNTCLYVDTTGGLFNKYGGKEIYYSVACFRGWMVFIRFKYNFNFVRSLK